MKESGQAVKNDVDKRQRLILEMNEKFERSKKWRELEALKSLDKEHKRIIKMFTDIQ